MTPFEKLSLFAAFLGAGGIFISLFQYFKNKGEVSIRSANGETTYSSDKYIGIPKISFVVYNSSGNSKTIHDIYLLAVCNFDNNNVLEYKYQFTTDRSGIIPLGTITLQGHQTNEYIVYGIRHILEDDEKFMKFDRTENLKFHIFYKNEKQIEYNFPVGFKLEQFIPLAF